MFSLAISAEAGKIGKISHFSWAIFATAAIGGRNEIEK